MLASHAALWLSTGSLEILVFHTLLAGNMGQFGAPGTTVVMAGAAATLGAGAALAGDVSVLAGTLPRVLVGALGCVLAVDAAEHPATKAAAAAIATMRRPT